MPPSRSVYGVKLKISGVTTHKISNTNALAEPPVGP
jgi:hypothetical protein